VPPFQGKMRAADKAALPTYFGWRHSAGAPARHPNLFKKPVAMPRFSDIFVIPFHPANCRLNRANGSLRIELMRPAALTCLVEVRREVEAPAGGTTTTSNINPVFRGML